jgi:hypothetical protein
MDERPRTIDQFLSSAEVVLQWSEGCELEKGRRSGPSFIARDYLISVEK